MCIVWKLLSHDWITTYCSYSHFFYSQTSPLIRTWLIFMESRYCHQGEWYIDFNCDLWSRWIINCCVSVIVTVLIVIISSHRSSIHCDSLSYLISVCLVLEICEYGSLSDVLRGMNAGGVTRQPLSLSYADRMYLARGCARGLQALHHYSPDLCHRDIKSMNFLSECWICCGWLLVLRLNHWRKMNVGITNCTKMFTMCCHL